MTVRKGAISVGQDGILRGDWKSPRVPGPEGTPNRHAAYQAAPQEGRLRTVADQYQDCS